MNELNPHNSLRNTVRFITQHAAPGSSIYFFFPFVSGAYPLVDYAPVSSASRFPGLVFLPGLYKKMTISANSSDVMQKKKWLINAVLQDFYRQPPTLVFVENVARIGYFDEKPFDYLRFFNSDVRFEKMFNTCYSRLAVHYNFVVYQKKCAKLS
jgi:hypothetical protein